MHQTKIDLKLTDARLNINIWKKNNSKKNSFLKKKAKLKKKLFSYDNNPIAIKISIIGNVVRLLPVINKM